MKIRIQNRPAAHTSLRTLVVALVLITVGARAQSTGFTFQGQLKENGAPASGNYDIQLKLYDTAAPGTGTQIGATLTFSAAPVTNGMFTVQPDFTANAFPGFDRFIEVGVKPAGSNSAFNILSPRQPITPTPYAIRSQSAATADSATNATNTTNASHATNADHASNADNATNASHATNADNASHAMNADNATNANTATNATHATNADTAATATNATNATNATQLGGAPASQYVQTGDGRLSDARPPLAGSTSYIQNTATPEAATINITGSGVFGGKIGIGTQTPTSKLEVVGSQDAVTLSGFQPFLTFYDSNAGFARGRIQAAGGDLNLFTESYLTGSNGSSFLKLANNGNVGIGTPTPNTKLSIIGGGAWTANGWAGSMNLQNGAALGWEANASGQRAGIGHSTGGLFFFRTNSGFGNTASPANYDMVITDGGDVTQPRDKGGFVKAMASINPFNAPSQYVVRAYNSQVAGNAITMARLGVGVYRVDFGFDVRDRFISATVSGSSDTVNALPYGDPFPNSVYITMYDTQAGAFADSAFFLFVY